VPSGFRFAIAPSDELVVPWPIYTFAAALAGVVAGVLVAAIVVVFRYRSRSARFRAQPDGRPSQVADAYAASTAGPAGGAGDGPAYAKHRAAIASTWSLALVTDDAPVATILTVGVSIIFMLAAELRAATTAGPAGHPTLLPGLWHGLATLIALVGFLVAGLLVALLRMDYSNTDRRKTIGALWDVGTFWPRAVHPLAPPCYAERAVPEIVDRIRLLTGRYGNESDDYGNESHDAACLHAEAGQPDLPRTRELTVPAGPLLLTGYSQGSVIAPAVIAQLPADVLPSVALLTLACPAQRLYGRAFPAYFGRRQLTELARLLDANTVPGQAPEEGQPLGRWKNLRRRSDYIGSWVFTEPKPRLSDADLRDNIDQPCWDPVILVQDANQTPPPTHRHSQWWQDPRTGELGAYLVNLLASQADPPSTPGQHSGAGDERGAQNGGPVEHPAEAAKD
jgi:hypothetical protein